MLESETGGEGERGLGWKQRARVPDRRDAYRYDAWLCPRHHRHPALSFIMIQETIISTTIIILSCNTLVYMVHFYYVLDATSLAGINRIAAT